ncbi:hypothetical protein AMAG_00543 [Allomyces macrogynus ATCC 38327]|uniref:DUF4549 domain-containing protein n=1 Tax=Allomyces macrogynus (strain ATCC 38327) TaxID=578462 RepID=A0A0L0RX00_ALLM3|nr:hypothetical protein AMAG_00543 [Allomyces macrogynus ATCC 38327]|eukprot:KNE54576.1 hypothetical protein AMAG_00543 [Allomyces macrogynus ATCC 38327]
MESASQRSGNAQSSSTQELDRLDDLGSIDKEIERMRRDLDHLYSMRIKEASVKGDHRKFRPAIVQKVAALNHFKELRDAKLEEVCTISAPSRLPMGADRMKREIEHVGQISKQFSDAELVPTLVTFYRDRILQLTEKRNMLLDRFRKITIDEAVFSKFRPAILQRSEEITSDLIDAAERYDRLHAHQEAVLRVKNKKDKEHEPPCVKLDDLRYYVKWLAENQRNRADFDVFFSRIKHLTSTDLEPLATVVQEELERSLPLRTSLPRKNPKSSDFIHDFEALASWFSISTPIDAEDGRSFAYAVDKLFQQTFTTHRVTAPTVEMVPPATQPADNPLNPMDSEENVRVPTVDAAPLKVTKTLWVEDAKRLFGVVRDNEATTQKHERTDFQIRYEHDVLASDDPQVAKDHLLMTLKYYTDEALLNRERDAADEDVAAPVRSTGSPSPPPSTTLLGMLFPHSEGGNVLMGAKRQKLFDALTVNEDAPPKDVADILPTRSPEDAAFIFLPHEIHAFLQLRFLKMRELRMTLFRQLNFFRSIERRLVADFPSTGLVDSAHVDPILFDVGSPLKDSKEILRKRQFDPVFDIEQHVWDKSRAEDHRVVRNKFIYVSNDEGLNIVYDATYSDLAQLEKKLLRIATSVIIRTSKDSDRDEFYLKHARARVHDRKEFMDTTFTNPELDRQQILHDLYESEVQLNERKCMLVNILMEMYDHTSWRNHRQQLGQQIVATMAAPRVLDSADECMLRAVHYQIRALEAQELLYLGVFNAAATRGGMSDYGAFNFYHGGAHPTHITRFVGGLDDIVHLPSHVRAMVRDLEVTIPPSDSIPASLLEYAVWQYLFDQWQQLDAAHFQKPPVPHPLLFHSDFATRADTLGQILDHEYQKTSGSLESLVHPVLGSVMAPTPLNDPAFRDNGVLYCIRYAICLLTYHHLMLQWLETHYLRERVAEQVDVLGVTPTTFFPIIGSLPFDVSLSDSARQIEYSDDEEPDQRSYKKKNDASFFPTPLAISEFDENWSHISMEDFSSLHEWCTRGPRVLAEALRVRHISAVLSLKFQTIDKYVHLAICETNYATFNRVDEILKKRSAGTVYSGDFTSTGFAPGPFKRQIRRLMMADYQTDLQKAFPNGVVGDTTEIKARLINTYMVHMIPLLHQQLSRIQVLKLARLSQGQLLGRPGNRAALLNSKSELEAAARDDTVDTIVDIDHGKFLRLWTAPQPLEMLSLQHRIKFTDLELASPGLPCVFSRLYQVYSLLAETMRLAHVLGDALNERGTETARQLMLAMKKEILNFGSPVHIDKLISYLSMRWSVQRLRLLAGTFAASHCLLTAPTLQPTMANFFSVYHYSQRLAMYGLPTGREAPCAPIPEFRLRSSAVDDLSITDRKLCTEKFNEIEAVLEDIYHASNLESLAVETALGSQIEYLRNLLRLHQLRFELLSATANRKPLHHAQVETYLSVYKTHINAHAYREFLAHQRRKGSHIEDVTATRAAQMEFEKCQVSALKHHLLILYSRAVMRAMRRLFDLLVDERTEALFANHSSMQIPRAYLVHDLPAELTDHDYLAKSALFEEFHHDLFQNSMKSTAPLLQFAREKSKALVHDDRSSTIEIDTNTHFVIRRELLAESLVTFSSKFFAWNQQKFREMDEFYSQLSTVSLDLLARQRALIEAYAVEQSMVASSYERDVRLGAAIKASDIFLQLSTLGEELNELKKARRHDEKLIRARVRQGYEDLVAELSSQIHMLKARFNEFRISSIEEMVAALNEVKREDLLAFVHREFHPEAVRVGKTMIALQDEIDELRDDNAELKQVMSKLKSMYTLKDRTSKSAYAKKMASLVEDKRLAEERLWESYRDSEAREKVLRRNLIKCQKDLVSLQTQHEVLRRTFKEEQMQKTLLQKTLSMHVNENKTAMEMASLRKVETFEFTRFEFERLLDENSVLHDEIAGLKQEVARLQNALQAREWRTATKQRLRMSPSRPSSPSPRTPVSPLPVPEVRHEIVVQTHRIPSASPSPVKRPMTAKREQIVVPAIRMPSRPRTAVGPLKSPSKP